MAGIDYVERIPNNVNLAENRRLQRALEDWQPKFLDWWRDMGPDGFQAKDAYLRTAISVDAAGLGQVRLHQDAGLPVGHLPRTGRSRTGRSTSATTWAIPRGRRCPASTAASCVGSSSPREIPSPRRSSSSAISAARARRSTTCATSSRSTWRRDATCGRWSICSTRTSGATAARSRRRSCSAARGTPTSPASSARSTRRRRTGSRTSCSASSPTATASTSSRAWRRAASTRSRAPAASCSPRKRTTCSWARRASAASCSARAS